MKSAIHSGAVGILETSWFCRNLLTGYSSMNDSGQAPAGLINLVFSTNNLQGQISGSSDRGDRDRMTEALLKLAASLTEVVGTGKQMKDETGAASLKLESERTASGVCLMHDHTLLQCAMRSRVTAPIDISSVSPKLENFLPGAWANSPKSSAFGSSTFTSCSTSGRRVTMPVPRGRKSRPTTASRTELFPELDARKKRGDKTGDLGQNGTPECLHRIQQSWNTITQAYVIYYVHCNAVAVLEMVRKEVTCT